MILASCDITFAFLHETHAIFLMNEYLFPEIVEESFVMLAFGSVDSESLGGTNPMLNMEKGVLCKQRSCPSWTFERLLILLALGRSKE